jgi:hypothetical protein
VVGGLLGVVVLGPLYGVVVWRDWPWGVYGTEKVGRWEGRVRGEGEVRGVYLFQEGGEERAV